jgi:hypothetical protein
MKKTYEIPAIFAKMDKIILSELCPECGSPMITEEEENSLTYFCTVCDYAIGFDSSFLFS